MKTEAFKAHKANMWKIPWTGQASVPFQPTEGCFVFLIWYFSNNAFNHSCYYTVLDSFRQPGNKGMIVNF